MSLDLAWDDAQAAVADAVAQFARERCPDDAIRAWEGRFPDELWAGLAELGLLSVATPEGDGGALEAVAALEGLGRVAAPGPIAETLVATQVLPAAERAAVARGEAVVGLAAGGFLAWPEVASIWLGTDGADVWRLPRQPGVETRASLAGDPWARVGATVGEPLAGARRGLVLGEIAIAALLAGAAAELVDRAAAHAAGRVQFGRAIGEFQAVAHPLADARLRVDAATGLARYAAFAFDGGHEDAPARAAAARLSARRAGLEAAYTAHQAFGAIGATQEGPVFHLSRRVRQWASHPFGLEPARDAVRRRFAEAEEAA